MKIDLAWDDPRDPDPICPVCEGQNECSCEATITMKPLEPHFDRDGDDPGRIKGHLRPGLYACLECCWTGHGAEAAANHIAKTTHDVAVGYGNRTRDRHKKSA